MLFWSTSSPLLGYGRKLFQSFLHSLWWAYALRQAFCLEIRQQTSLPRRWISASEKQDCRGSYTMSYRQYHQRDPIKKYFPLPNEIFSLGLSFGEIAVYAYLMYCEDRQTYQCYPSYKTIDMSRNTVAKYVKDLDGKAIHPHRADQNPHQRWSLLQRKPELHHPSDRGRDPVFSRASGSAALDAICTHSVGIGFYHKFEPDLSRVWHFLRQAG